MGDFLKIKYNFPSRFSLIVNHLFEHIKRLNNIHKA